MTNIKKFLELAQAKNIPIYESENELLDALDKGVHGIAILGHGGFIPPDKKASGSSGSVAGSNT